MNKKHTATERASVKAPATAAGRTAKHATSKVSPPVRKRAPAPKKTPKTPARTSAKPRTRQPATAPRPKPARKPAPQRSKPASQRRKPAPQPPDERHAITELRRLAAERKTALADLLALLAHVGTQIPTGTAPANVYAVALENDRPGYLLARSQNPNARLWHGTQREMIDEAIRLSGATTPAFLTDALELHARRIIGSYTPPPDEPTNGRRRRAGVNDAAFLAAYNTLRAQDRPITASTLAKGAGLGTGGFRTAKHWAARTGVQLDNDARRRPTPAPPSASAAASAETTPQPSAPIANAPQPSATSATPSNTGTDVDGVTYEHEHATITPPPLPDTAPTMPPTTTPQRTKRGA